MDSNYLLVGGGMTADAAVKGDSVSADYALERAIRRIVASRTGR